MAEAESMPPAVPAPLNAGYVVDGAGYDEMCSAAGVLRPQWRELMHAFDEMGGDELENRNDELRRLLQENGVTYNVHGDLHDTLRPWMVDPVPILMTEAEWRHIDAALQQRSQLLDLVLADLYGPHALIRDGLLPPELIYSHPGFQHPCYQSLPCGRRWLIFHAMDLARVADGSVWVLGDHAQCPSGAGYALENRIIMARVFPGLYRDAPLRRLAGFLEAERATLAALALHNKEHPHMVLLSPGPVSESYFEHAYLANYLSLNLVEGQDLVVRDGRVWLKTLGGLRPVDVILRRVPDEYCDPLELRGDSLLGVPGLLQAVRSDGVAIASALGCGILENPGLLAFLPALCRHLLGEELRLPSVNTWWCGSDSDREYVLANLDRLVIRSILPEEEPRLGHYLSRVEKETLNARIQAEPHLFIGQEPVHPSTAPTLQDGRLVPRPVTFRCFTVANQEQGYRVMPGGLARVSTGLDSLRSSLQRGGISKDLWVLAPAPQKHISLLRQAYGPIVVTRDGSDLPSRVADNLYWLGRYCERLDGTARLLREALGQLLELQEQTVSEDNCLYDLLTALEVKAPLTANPSRSQFVPLRRHLLRLLADADRSGGLPKIFAGMMHNGRSVRDQLGDDSWRLLNRIQRTIQEVPPGLTAREARERLEGLITLLAAFAGLNNETMPHHFGWLFLDIGRQLERVLHTLDLFKLAFVAATHPGVSLWQVVLSTTDNLTAYRRRYRSALHPKAIIDLLLFDEGNPRSLGYQLQRLQRQIDRLPHSQRPYRSAEERLILEAVSVLQLADIQALSLLEIGKPYPALVKLLNNLDRPLEKLSDALTHSHFSHAEEPRQLIAM